MQQIFLNSLIAACVYTLTGIGFSLIYQTTRFFHFSHGIVLAWGAYFTYLFNVSLGLPFIVSVLLGIVCSGLFGCFLDLSIYKQLRSKGASSLVLLLASLGLYIIFQNIISITFGDHILTIRSGTVQEGISLWGTRITQIQIITIISSVLSMFFIIIFLRKSKIGLSIRAVANNFTISTLSGIDSNWVILWSFGIGSALAGLAGIFIALDYNLTPSMGMHALLMGVVAMIIGGVENILGVFLGALLLAMAQNFGVLKISSQWQDGIAFLILFFFLLFLPQGFLGRKTKRSTI